MRFNEIESRPKMVKLHYFSVTDDQYARELGMKQDRNGQWFMPQYNTSGRGFDQKVTSAIRTFGRPFKSVSLN
jgi:hypothetical protein